MIPPAMGVVVALLSGCHLVFGVDFRDPDGGELERCPTDGYVPIVGAPSTSTYRQVPQLASWQIAHEDCKNDSLGGITHLVVFDDASELGAVRVFPAAGIMYVRAGYARETGSDPNLFYAVTGEELVASSPLWEAGEPNNMPTEETTTAFTSTRELIDLPARSEAYYVCECDERPATLDLVVE